jgi:hypothetical protein
MKLGEKSIIHGFHENESAAANIDVTGYGFWIQESAYRF